MIRSDQAEQVQNATVYDSAGQKVGKAGSVYFDDTTGEPSWVTVKTGLFGNNESFTPLDGASVSGDRVDVPYTKQQIQDAPNLPADGHLEPEQERDLYRYFAKVSAVNANPGSAEKPNSTNRNDRDTKDVGDTKDLDDTSNARDRGDDRDASDIRDDRRGTEDAGPEPDTAGTREETPGRLRKYVVTEQHTITVPVERGEVRVEPAAADRDANDDEDVQR